MRKFAFLVGLLFLVSFSAAAQDNPKVDVFGGYSYLRFEPNAGTLGLNPINFNGGVGSIAYNVTDWIAGVAEVGGYHAGTIKVGGVTQSGVSANAISYLFGPKIYKKMGKITPFGQILFGGTHGSATANSGSYSQNGFAMAAGGGLDWGVTPHFAVRLAQVDYVLTRYGNTVSNGLGSGGTGTQNSFRYSAGVVFQF